MRHSKQKCHADRIVYMAHQTRTTAKTTLLPRAQLIILKAFSTLISRRFDQPWKPWKYLDTSAAGMTSYAPCATCQGLLMRPHESMLTKTSASYTHDGLIATAKECPLCFWILKWLHSLSDGPNAKLAETGHVLATLHIGEYDYEERCFELDTTPPEYTDTLRVDAKLWPNQSTDFAASFSILLRALAKGPHGFEAILKPSNDLFERERLPASAKQVATTTRDPSCWMQVRAWIKECVENHTLCRRRLALPGYEPTTCFNPTRLIDIRDPDTQFLVETKNWDSAEPVRYVTLSHRWAACEMLKLTRSNIAQLMTSIHANTLPPVFKDAIEISRSLEVPYLWIDALCIIQNDAEDWAKEAALMGQVYSNAFCNLGASAAAEKTVGLYLDRDPRQVSLCRLRVQRTEINRTYGSYLKPDSMMTARVLLSRGWVLQERLLSPRSIYYDEKLHWECTELHACETFPNGGPVAGTISPWGKDGFPFRVANLLYDDDTFLVSWLYNPEEWSPTTIRAREVYRKWLCVVEYFSNCQLTYEEDRFPALMGLAKHWQVITKDEYVAGIWKGDLGYGLLWYQKDPCHKRPQPKDYRAPSWSWASVNSAVYFPLAHPGNIATRGEEDIWAAKIVEVVAQPSGTDPMGRLSGAKIRVTAPTRRPKQPFDLSSDTRNPLHIHWLDECAYRDGYSANRTVLLLLTYRVNALHGTHQILRLTGLILERVAGKKVFKRIGMFEHGWFQHRLADGEWPLFIDWDPLCEKKTTLSII